MDREGDGEPVDEASDEVETGDGAEDAGFERWRKESALGAVGTGIARGFHSVFAAPVDEVVIMAAVPGDPPTPINGCG